MSSIIDDTAAIDALFDKYGSPVNIHHMAPFGDNISQYQAVLDDHGLRSRLYFARKANKCTAFVREAQRLGIGVDAASVRELSECLDVGCDPDTLVLTAAVKNAELMQLAVDRDVLITVDNADECDLANRLASAADTPVDVGIRISGFRVDGHKLYSRFGFDVDDVVRWILGGFSEYSRLRFRGFHFHLDGYSRAARAEALIATARLVDELRANGVATAFVDMGGGFLMNYLEDAEQWEAFFDALRDAVAGRRAPITFGNDGLGYRHTADGVQGAPQVYPYYNETPQARFLGEVLDYRRETGPSVAEMLRRRNLELRLEPGRSLLDQCGITLARVVHRKRDRRGDVLVGLQMNRTQMFSSSADYLLDPQVIYRGDAPRTDVDPTDAGVGVYFTGAYCLEQDVLLKRKITIPQVPEVGDVVCFFNTAGYMMHFYESQAHLFDLAANVIATTADHRPLFVADADCS